MYLSKFCTESTLVNDSSLVYVMMCASYIQDAELKPSCTLLFSQVCRVKGQVQKLISC